MATNRQSDETHAEAGRDAVHDVAWRFGAGGVGFGRRISGPRDFVEDLADTGDTTLLRCGVFVVTFVPITTTFVAKLPEIITAFADAFC